MLVKYFRLGLAVVVLLGLLGCAKEESDNRFLEINLKQDSQGRQIASLAREVDRLEQVLAEILDMARRRAVGSGSNVVDFRSTPEYEDMAAAILAIQQQLNITQSQIAETKAVLEKQPEPPMRGPRRRMVSTVGNREELRNKLDSLAQKFAEVVGDPLPTRNLVADVEQFKQELLDDRPPAEVYQALVAELTQRVENEQNGALRGWGEKCLRALESASQDNLPTRVQEGTDFQNALRLRDLASNNKIPQSVLKDLGLDTLILTRTNDTGTGAEAMGFGPVGMPPEGPHITGGTESSGGPTMHSSESSSAVPSPIGPNP